MDLSAAEELGWVHVPVKPDSSALSHHNGGGIARSGKGVKGHFSHSRLNKTDCDTGIAVGCL